MVAGVPILDCQGTLEFGASATELLMRAKQVLEEHKKLVINLAEVKRADSAGVGTLFSIYISATKNGSRMALLNLNPQPHGVLTSARLLPLVEVYGDEVSAVTALGAVS